ncbi:MAG: beta strand repeat-containing protein [Phycisphaerales bacterium]
MFVRHSSLSGGRVVSARGLAALAGGAASLLSAAASSQAAAFDWLVPGSGNWSTAANWSPTGVPLSAGDTATIAATGASYTVTLDVSPTLDAFTLNSADATMVSIGRTMTVSGASTISAGTLRLQSSAWLGAGVLSNAANLIIEGSTTIANLSNTGSMTVRGVPGLNSGLTVSNPFTNSGTLTFTSTTFASANLSVGGSGVFTNAAAGTVMVDAGSGGPRVFDANVENAGAFTVAADANLNRASGVHKNTGAFTVNAARTLTMSGNNQRFEQNGGTLTVDGTFAVDGSTFRLSGGAIGGAGRVVVTSGRLEMGGGGTGSVTVRGTSTMSGGIVSGQTVRVQGEPGLNTTVTTDNGTTNVGTLIFTSTINAAANMNVGGSGTLSNFGSLNILAGAGGPRSYNWNLSNQAAGTVEVDADTTFSGPSRSHTTAGQFHIATGRTLTVSASNQTFTLTNGTLDVDGVLDVVNATFFFNGGTLTGDGTARVTNGRLSLGASGTGTIVTRGAGTMVGNIKANQIVLVRGEPSLNTVITADDSFTNAGTLTFTSTVNASSNMTVSGGGGVSNNGTINILAGATGPRTYIWNLANNPSGTVNIDAAAVFTGTGRVHANAGNFKVLDGRSLTIDNGNQTFTQTAGTLNVDGLFDTVSSTLTLNGGAITGAGTVRTTNGRLTFGPGSTATGTVVARGNGTMAGDVPVGMNVLIRGEPSLNTVITADDSFLNHGSMTFTSTVNAASNMIVNGGGVLTNNGTLSILTGATGPRTYNWNLSNAGTGMVTVAADAVFAGLNRVHKNAGAFGVSAGALLTVSANSQVFEQNAGTLTVDGVLDVAAATLRFNGGTIGGAGTTRVTNGRLELGALPGGNGTVVHRGSGTMSGNIRAGTTVLVRGEPSLNTSITADDSFSSAGTLTFTSLVNAAANMTISGGRTLTNTGTVNVLQGASGPRSYDWNLTNNAAGTVNIDATGAQFVGTGRTHDNAGTFNVTAGSLLTINGGGQTFAQSGGTLDVDGLFDVVGSTLAFNGGAITGDGTVRVTNGRLTHGAGGTGTVVHRGSGTMAGNIPAGHRTLIRGEPSINTSITADDSFTNAGQMEFTSLVNASANLTVLGGRLFTNSGVVTILTGATGPRVISAVLNNTGLVESSAAASIGVAGANHTNSGIVRVGTGTLTLTGDTATNTGTGSVQGIGTLDVTALGADGLGNGANIDPGLGFMSNDAASIGALRIQGALVQQAAGALRVNLAGLTGGQFDVLNVSGAASLAGSVRVGLLPGFLPQVGDAFRIMTFGSRSGSFGGATIALGPAGYSFDLVYGGTFMDLVVTAIPAPGAAGVLGAGAILALRRRR